MWTETAENRLKELGLTKEQIDKLSDETAVGVNIITSVLLKAKQMELVNNGLNMNFKKWWRFDTVKTR
jgi:hypothetical protein